MKKLLLILTSLLPVSAFGSGTPADFNAVGNCIVDDTTAMQNWAASGGELELTCPTSCYKVMDSISIPANTVVRGTGCAFPEIQNHADNGHVMRVYQADNVIIENVGLNGRKDLKLAYGNALVINDSENVIIRDVKATNARSGGIIGTNNAKYVLLQNAFVMDNNEHGVSIHDVEHFMLQNIFGRNNDAFVVNVGNNAHYNLVNSITTDVNERELMVFSGTSKYNAVSLMSGVGTQDNGLSISGDWNVAGIGVFRENDHNGAAVYGSNNVAGLIVARDNNEDSNGYDDLLVNTWAGSTPTENIVVGLNGETGELDTSSVGTRVIGVLPVPVDNGTNNQIGDYINP
ncbi:MAG: hypothetical protein MI867_12380 [Pseudomonadales bacterium]|nr:hypothetical protein [Pseudomonadales bacterium]